MRKVCTVLLLLLIPISAYAAEDAPGVTLPKVVVTATRSEDDPWKVPAKIEVIDEKTIELTVGETITEQLKKNSSLNVIEYPGALAGIGIRGFRPEFSGITKRSLLLINGRPAGATNLATILSNNIERIEVLKGPASSLYGAEAMGGVVNIITKKNTGAPTAMVEAGFGSFETDFQRAAVGGGLGKNYDFDLSVRRFEQSDDYRMGSGETRANTGYRTQNGSLRIGLDLAGGWRMDVSGDLYQGRDIETPGDIFDGDSKSGSKDIDRYSMDLTVEGKTGPANRLSVTAYRANETSENYKNYTGWSSPVPADPYRSYDSEIDWTGLQIKDVYDRAGYTLIVGADYQEIEKKSRSYNQDGTRKAPYSPDEGRTNRAAYVETVWRLLDERLTLTAGARYDAFDVETKKTPYKTDFTPNTEGFSTLSPRAGLNYLAGNGIRIHSTVGKAFVPPTAAELAGYSERVVSGTTMITRGNPDLDPESSITYDVGVGYERPEWGLAMDITYFYTDVDDKIIKVTSGNTTTYRNSLSAEMEGIEALFSMDIGTILGWSRSLSVFVNSTRMLNAEEEQEDGTVKDIHNVARYTVNYGVGYDDGTLEARLHLRSRGRMKDTDWNAAGYPEVEYPSFTVVDLTVGVTPRKGHRITLKADNLLDEDYYEKKGYPKPGRAFYLSYRYGF